MWWYFLGQFLLYLIPAFFVLLLLRRVFSKGIRFKFNTRTLLIVVLYISICLAWAVPEITRKRREERSVITPVSYTHLTLPTNREV